MERLDHVLAEHVLLLVTRQLENPAPQREHPALRVADDEARARRRVVIVEELEQEAESAVPALRRPAGEAVHAVDVDGALLAVGADEPGHAGDGSRAD